MKQKIKLILLFVLPLAIAALPLISFGASPIESGLSQISQPFGGGSGLTRARSVQELIVAVINIMLFFAGIIAVLFIILGGYWYITSAGNDEQAEKGRKALTNAVIGLAIAGLAYVIVNAVVGTLQRGTGILG